MPKFLISYRLKDDDSYAARRTSLVSVASWLDPLAWDEATSLIHLSCNGNAVGVRDYLLRHSAIYRDGRDLLLIEEVTVHAYASIGMRYDAIYNLATGTTPTDIPAVSPVQGETIGLGNYLPNLLMQPKKL